MIIPECLTTPLLQNELLEGGKKPIIYCFLKSHIFKLFLSLVGVTVFEYMCFVNMLNLSKIVWVLVFALVWFGFMLFISIHY